MTIKRLYGSDGYVGGDKWELFYMENPTEAERWRWLSAMDDLFPPAMPDDISESETP